MDFKQWPLKKILPVLIPGVLLAGLLLWKLTSKANPPAEEIVDTVPEVVKEASAKKHPAPAVPVRPAVLTAALEAPATGANQGEEAAIQEQLDRDRSQQKQTKDLKIKLEQAHLVLEQEKALVEIDKLKKENAGAFTEPVVDGQNNFPEIRVAYIGGDSVKKEAIISIGGASFQVKEKSRPVASIQVMSISDSGVTLHFTAPEELTKTFDYKPD